MRIQMIQFEHLVLYVCCTARICTLVLSVSQIAVCFGDSMCKEYGMICNSSSLCTTISKPYYYSQFVYKRSRKNHYCFIPNEQRRFAVLVFCLLFAVFFEVLERSTLKWMCVATRSSNTGAILPPGVARFRSGFCTWRYRNRKSEHLRHSVHRKKIKNENNALWRTLQTVPTMNPASLMATYVM